MPRPWRDRTGETFGPYRVLGPGPTSDSWQVVCRCGSEYTKTTPTLLGAANQNSKSCRACSGHHGQKSQRETGAPYRPSSAKTVWPSDPVGLLQQQWISRGFLP